MPKHELIVLRGGGDLATGVAQKFYRAGFRVLILEVEKPTAIRRGAALSEAVYDGFVQVEDVPCRHIHELKACVPCWQKGVVPIFIDPAADSVAKLMPHAVVDAVLAKHNLGTHRGMAAVTIGLGPGFFAGGDVDAVIETMRGHDLGRLILSGAALPNTGVPGEIAGKSRQRVLHTPVAGEITHIHEIGDIVQEGEPLMEVGGQKMTAPFTGLLRGLIHDGLAVPKGMKVADIDPRTDVNWRTISDKARCLGGAALEAYFYLRGRQNKPEEGFQ